MESVVGLTIRDSENLSLSLAIDLNDTFVLSCID